MAGLTTSSKALIYFSERVEDATEAVKGLIGGSGSAKYLDTLDERTSVIRSQLESDRDDLRLEGLRTIVALLSKGRDASSHFPHVLKLASNPNLEIKKMVYIVVRRYAKRQPDVALLGINSFQRDLLDRSEVIRAMALRVLSGLQLPLVASVVEVAISKSVKDPHFYVRKGAALAIIKCYKLAPHIRPALKGHLSILLNDRNPAVLSTALVALAAISPKEVEVLHPHYRKLCHALSDMDEWGQRNAIEVLGLYARRCFAKPSDGEPLDVDLQLLFAKVEDLLMSRNAAVVTAAIRLLHTMAPPSYHSAIARPLLRLTMSSPGIAYFALLNCYLLAQSSPLLLSPHVQAFYLRSTLQDASHISSIKLKILALLSDVSNSEAIMSELSEQARYNSSDQVSQTAVEQLGVLAKKDARCARDCVRELLQIVKECNDRDAVVGTAVDVLRRILHYLSDAERSLMVNRLASLLFTVPSKKNSAKKAKLVGKGTVKSELARSCIYWMLGQYCRLEVEVKRRSRPEDNQEVLSSTQRQALAQVIGPDILRRAAINFSKEGSSSKLQIITLSSKLAIFLPTVSFDKAKSIKLLHGYIMQLARYDEDFDVRDRGRFCKALVDRADSLSVSQLSEHNEDGEGIGKQLGGVILRRDQVLHILFEGKDTSDSASIGNGTEDEEEKKTSAALDTLSYALGGPNALSKKGLDFCSVDWADAKNVSPSSVRQPVLFATTTRPGLLDGQSLSSEYVNEVRTDKTSVATTKGAESVPTPTSSSTAAKYKDLDAFLEEESEEEEAEDSSEEEVDQIDHDDEEDEEDEDEDGIEANSEGSLSSEDEESEEDSEDQEGVTRTETASLLPSALEEQNEWAR